MGCIGTVIGFGIVLALAGFGIVELIAAKEHGDSPFFPFVLLAIPLLAVGVLVAKLASAALMRGRAPAVVQAVATLTTAALLGGGLLVAVDANVVNRRPSAQLTTALAPACAGREVPGAASVDDSGNHLVMLDTEGHEMGWTGFPPVAWRPASLDDAELVTCVGPETSEVVQVCDYVGGSDITRYAASREFAVMEAGTGREVARFVVTVQPQRCQATAPRDVTEHRASVDWAIVEQHLASLVERGVFEDPDGGNGDGRVKPSAPAKPIESATPRTTPATRASPAPAEPPTARPTAGPTPTSAVTSMELRKAIAAGRVTASGRGEGLQRLELTLTSKVEIELRITVNIGTLFDPGASGTQTMVVIAPASVTLEPRAKVTLELEVACAEMRDDQPGSDDRFTVRATQASSTVMKLLRSEGFAAQRFRIQQFAIWTLVDNPRRDDYARLTSGLGLIGSGPSDTEFDTIESLLRAAGIDPARYRAFR